MHLPMARTTRVTTNQENGFYNVTHPEIDPAQMFEAFSRGLERMTNQMERAIN